MAEKMKIPRQQLAIELAHDPDEDSRTIEAVFYSGTVVRRHDFWSGETWNLKLSLDPAHVDLSRLNSGGPVILDHELRLQNVVGVVSSPRIEGGKLKGTLRFGRDPIADSVWTKVKDKIARNLSVGVDITKMKDITAEGDREKTYLATSWTPLEVSVVAVGADAGAQFLKQQQSEQLFFNEVEIIPLSKKETIMESNTAINNPDREEIQKAVRLANSRLGANLDEAFCQRLINNGTSLADARNEIFNKLADISEENPIRTAHASITRDNGETERSGLQNLMLHRFNPTRYPFPQGQVSGPMTLLEIARRELEIRGHRTRGKRDSEIIQLSFQSTSEFPNLFTSTGDRRLADAYAESASPIRQLFRIVDAKDFRPKTVVKFQGVTDLLQVNEGGEIKHAPAHEEAESYTPQQFARQTTFTEQAMKNDDLEALMRLPDEFGRAAARLEADLAVALLQSNAGLGPTLADGQTLFYSTHSNVSGSGGAIADATLAAGLLAIRLQKNLDGTSTLGLMPKFLLVPATKEVLARQQTAVIYPATTTDANPLQGTLTVLAESRLDAGSTTRWYMACSPDQAAVFELAFLDGRRGPRIESKTDWDRLGLAIRCIHEIGVGVIDHRGIYSNAGA